MNPKPGRRQALAIIAAAALFAAGCGDDDGEVSGANNGGGDSEVTTLKVGVLPIQPVAPVYLGIDKGFFADEGLEVEPQIAAGGAAIVPSLESGDYQVGFSNAISLMIAAEQGLNMRVIAPGEASPAQADADNTALIVPKNSSIRDVEGLDGKVVGVNTLNNISGVAVEHTLEQQGVDPKSIELVEVAYPDTQAAIESGRIDAALFNEPFTTSAEAAGHRFLARPYADLGPEFPIAPYFATAEYADANADVIERFQRALGEATEYAIDNPDEVRRILAEYTEIPPEAIAEIRPPVLGTNLDEARFSELAEIAAGLGYIEGDVDVDELVMAPGEG